MSNPTIYDYPTLCAAISGWLDRTDLDARIPDFVRAVETICNRQLRSRYQMTIVQASVLTNTPYVELPGDFAEALALRFVGSPYVNMGNYSPDALANTQQNDQWLGFLPVPLFPKGVAFTDDYLNFYPLSPVANTLELWYYAKVPALDDYNPSNWLLQNDPDVYLYGALSESAPYLRDDERISLWSSRFGAAIDAANTAWKKMRYSAGPLRYRPRVIR